MDHNFSEVDKVLQQLDGVDEKQRPLPAGKPHKYRPTLRPPMAILQIFDDGRESCESMRIRSDLTTIGRTGCDASIPHDNQIAPTHVIIQRISARNKFHWSIEDVSEGKGLFVRVRRARLRHHSEFLAGSQRFIFHGAEKSSAAVKSSLSQRLDAGSIPDQSSYADGIACASVSLCRSTGTGPKLWLLGNEYWIGRDESCGLRVADDEFMAPKHVKLLRQGDGDWHALTDKAPNGLWIRINAIKVKNTCTFQIGEQRFRLTIC